MCHVTALLGLLSRSRGLKAPLSQEQLPSSCEVEIPKVDTEGQGQSACLPVTHCALSLQGDLWGCWLVMVSLSQAQLGT